MSTWQIDADGALRRSALQWARGSRWFPSSWNHAAHWDDAWLCPLGPDLGILVFRPAAGGAELEPGDQGPWLQLPVRYSGDECSDASGDPDFWRGWLAAATLAGAIPGGNGSAGEGFVGDGSGAASAHTRRPELVSVQPLGAEQSNTSVVLGLAGDARWVAKVFRVVHPGPNPDVTLPLLLRSQGFTETPAVRAFLDLPLPGDSSAGHAPAEQGTRADAQIFCSSVAADLVDVVGTAWDYFSARAAAGAEADEAARELGGLCARMERAFAAAAAAAHQAEAEAASPGAGAPSNGDLGTDWESVRARIMGALDAALVVAELDPGLVERLRAAILELTTTDHQPALARIHGDLHLGQILQGSDGSWHVIDFEGEPLRSLAERQRSDTPMRDLAGILRSFNYASPNDPAWAARAREAFLDGYQAERGPLNPEESKLQRLLEIEKALYEVAYDAQFRPTWVHIPLASIPLLAPEHAAY